MNITLVDASAFPNGFMGSYYFSAPLGLLSLAGAVRDVADKVLILDDKLPNQRILKKTDVLGIRAMTHNIPYALNLFQTAKQINPDIITVIGGFHASLNPNTLNKDFIDYIVLREGEISFRKIVLGEVSERIVESPLIENLDDLPFPAYDLVDSLKYHSMGIRAIMLETSRGCPYNCNFCSVRSFFKNTYRFKSIPRVIQEIRRYTKRNQVAMTFIDDNHTANVRRAMNLCDAIVENGLDHLLYFCQSRVDTLAKNPQLVKKMADVGYYSIFLGVESPYEASLSKMNKNQTWEHAREAIKLCNDHGIGTYVSIIVGTPNETEAMVRQYPKYIHQLNPSITQFCVYTPFPNTEAYKEIEQSILIHDLQFYDASVCVYRHPNIDPRRLNELYIKIYEEYYSNVKDFFSTLFIISRIAQRMIPRRIKKRLQSLISSFSQFNLIESSRMVSDSVFNNINDILDLYRLGKTAIAVWGSRGKMLINQENIEAVNRKFSEILEKNEG